ncbi:MAG TPA: hypothetical protein DDY20_09655 [Desulfobulbaceae bacterium]|nr:hypothetical protein [Desulfobulbaceae bacterium]
MDMKSTLRGVGLAMLLAGLFLLGGCAGLGPQAKPRVSLANLQVLEIRALETVFLVELRVLNPGETPLQIRGIDCELKVDDRHFATGLSGDSYEIPAYGSITIPVPVYASMIDMVSSVVARLQQPAAQPGTIDPLRYELVGHVRLTGGIGGAGRTLPFASKGEFSLVGQHQQR